MFPAIINTGSGRFRITARFINLRIFARLKAIEWRKLISRVDILSFVQEYESLAKYMAMQRHKISVGLICDVD